MNIAVIANFGARFGTRMRSAVRRFVSPRQVINRNLSVADAINDNAARKAVPLTAVWHVNPQNGRLECRWTKDSEELAAHQSLPVLERFGLILAVSQRNRPSNWVH